MNRFGFSAPEDQLGLEFFFPSRITRWRWAVSDPERDFIPSVGISPVNSPVAVRFFILFAKFPMVEAKDEFEEKNLPGKIRTSEQSVFLSCAQESGSFAVFCAGPGLSTD